MTLQLWPVVDRDKAGEPVFAFTVGDGHWEQVSIDVPPGSYQLQAALDDPAWASVPARYYIGVPERGMVWRYGTLAFEFVRRDRAEERFGYPFCPPNARSTPSPLDTPTPTPSIYDMASVPTCDVFDSRGVSALTEAIGGKLIGLKVGDKATVIIYRVPEVDGHCYSTAALHGVSITPGQYEMLSKCTPFPPEAIRQVSAIPKGELAFTFSTAGPMWGLVWDKLWGGRRYVVVVEAEGYDVTPLAYVADIPSLYPGQSGGGVDFMLKRKAGR